MTEERNSAVPVPEASASEAVAAALGRIEARLDRLEQRLGGVGDLAATAPAAIATAVDTADVAIARLGERGVDVDARLRSLLRLTEKLTEPSTLEALESGLEMLRNLPATVATVADTVDGAIARLTETGIDVDERLQIVGRVAERLTAPEALEAVCEFLSHMDSIHRLLESGIFSPGAVDVVDRAARALAEADLTGARPVGAFGAMRALGDSDVQRSLGALVEIGRRFGRTIQSPAADGDPSENAAEREAR